MGPTFTYPDYGTPDGYPDHTAHSGHACTVIRELGDDERDPEVGRMFIVGFADGAELCVHAEELSEVPPEAEDAVAEPASIPDPLDERAFVLADRAHPGQVVTCGWYPLPRDDSWDGPVWAANLIDGRRVHGPFIAEDEG